MTTLGLYSTLHRAHQIADEIWREDAARAGLADLTARQAIVIATIAQARADGISPSQTMIVTLTGIDRSTLAEIIGRLLRMDVLARRRNRFDARAYALRLTDAGQVIAGKLPAIRAAAEARVRLIVRGLDGVTIDRPEAPSEPTAPSAGRSAGPRQTPENRAPDRPDSPPATPDRPSPATAQREEATAHG